MKTVPHAQPTSAFTVDIMKVVQKKRRGEEVRGRPTGTHREGNGACVDWSTKLGRLRFATSSSSSDTLHCGPEGL